MAIENVNEYLRTNLETIGGAIYIAPSIPTKKLNNAVVAYNFDGDVNTVIGLFDNTVFGSAKDGILFTGSGLTIKHSSTVKNIKYEEIEKVENS